MGQGQRFSPLWVEPYNTKGLDRMNEQPEETSIPLVSEEVHPGARQVVTGGVRVTKHVVPHEEILQQELRHDQVEVRRVQLNRQVDGPQAPHPEGDTLAVPVMEEVLQVQRGWLLKEEVHIRRVTQSEVHQEEVVVSRDEAQIERLDGAGNPVDNHADAPTPTDTPTPANDARREGPSILQECGAGEPGRGLFRKRSILGGSSNRRH